MPIWLLWNYELVRGRWTKVPVVADESRRAAKSNDHRTWRPFQQALTLADTADGLGMCITGEYCGFDLDCCRDEESGAIAPWAGRIIALLNSYTEVSPSGTGVHTIVKLKRELPTGRRMRGGKERCGWEIALFDKSSPRYFAVTGVVLDGHDSIRLCDPQEFFPEFEMGGLDPQPVKSNGKAPDSDDQKLNKRARLIRGEWEGLYASQSEADAALVWFFAFDYGNDPVLIDRAFRNSGMMRPKWDEPRPEGTYGTVTINHCLEKRRADQFIRSDKGKLLPVLANALTALRGSNEWKGVLAFDEFSLNIVSHRPAPWQKPSDVGRNWADYESSMTAEHAEGLSWAYPKYRPCAPFTRSQHLD